jgi:hypothetical protein
MADLINAFIVKRLQKGVYSMPTGWGFRYTLPPEVEGFIEPIEITRARWTPFDRYGSLYDQRHRFSQLSKLAKQRLEARGFKVRRLHIYDNGKGIYVKWDVKDPSTRSTWFDFDGIRFLEDMLYPKPPTYEQVYGDNEEDKFDGREVCQGTPNTLCRMQNLFDSLGEIFP